MLAVVANVERLKKQDDKSRGDPAVASPWYMKQSGRLDNACGVIACLHAVYNNLELMGGLAPGGILASHLAATETLSPEERAAALEANASFQQVHKAKASEGGSAIPQEQSEVKHHFVAFVVRRAGPSKPARVGVCLPFCGVMC